ncbi:HDOD domain-containing protein [Maridesulfovibrio sp. FT414]|uniref:HDOD domain-containing protein n=1 Tax=Maridesulfovibrio sp. FT414 TaxID=2979469 RepID=UPI003D807945
MSQDLKTSVKGQILSTSDLPTLPSVLDEVSKLVDDPNSSTEQVAKVISQDQVLSAKVLKMVNSPIYGFPGRITTIQHALVLLGLNVIRGIIISTSVFDMIQQAMSGLWEHSLGCAIASGAIAKAAGFEDPEEFTVAGLLHDLGKVVTAVQLPELNEAIRMTVKQNDVSYYEAERLILGFGHDRINAWLARHWNLPPNVREAMTYHHHPDRAQFYQQTSAVVHVADFMVRLFEYGNGGDDQIAYFKPAAMKILKLKMKDLEPVMDELSDQFVEISGFSF